MPQTPPDFVDLQLADENAKHTITVERDGGHSTVYFVSVKGELPKQTQPLRPCPVPHPLEDLQSDWESRGGAPINVTAEIKVLGLYIQGRVLFKLDTGVVFLIVCHIQLPVVVPLDGIIFIPGMTVNDDNQLVPIENDGE